MTCYGIAFGYGVAICRDKELQLDYTGRTIEKTCSAYICGACFGFWSERVPRVGKRSNSHEDDDDDDRTCRKDNVVHISPMRQDVFVRGPENVTEHEIENMLVKRFGHKQNKHNMTIIMIDDIEPPSSEGCK
ncbi:hypothetical protein FBU30_008669 [Linnemannia zychae]|nr:hypothetical protein FBU30_008669 [Linnemannia zychae]